MKDAKAKHLKVLCDVIIAMVASSGDLGMPGDELYAHMMVFGVDLERFKAIMRALVATRQVSRRGQLYFAKGRGW